MHDRMWAPAVIAWLMFIEAGLLPIPAYLAANKIRLITAAIMVWILS